VVTPAKGPAARFHDAKYKVFHRLHQDAMAYRRIMSAV
jgi:hypothetical protein